MYIKKLSSIICPGTSMSRIISFLYSLIRKSQNLDESDTLDVLVVAVVVVVVVVVSSS